MRAQARAIRLSVPLNLRDGGGAKYDIPPGLSGSLFILAVEASLSCLAHRALEVRKRQEQGCFKLWENMSCLGGREKLIVPWFRLHIYLVLRASPKDD